METQARDTIAHHDRMTVSDIPLWYNRISWGAIFAGLVIALAVQILLTLLGAAIGLSTINPSTEANPMNGLGMGGLIWFAISSIISMFIGGWISGKLANGNSSDGMLHGAVVWGLATVVTIFLLTTAVGRVVSGVGNLVGAGLAASGTAIAAAGPDLADSAKDTLRKNGFDLENIKAETETILRQTGKPELQPETLRTQAQQAANQATATAQANADTVPVQQNANISQLMDNLFREGQDTVQAADREAAVNVLVARGQTQAEAERTVDGWIGTYQTARQKMQVAEAKARQMAEETAAAAAKGALWAFIASLLGLIAAAIGGRMSIKTIESRMVNTQIRR